MRLPFQDADPAHKDFQFLENLSTAYWYSETLFAALDLKLFECLEQGSSTLEALARAAGCQEEKLRRLLRALESLDLVHAAQNSWFNSQVARLYLLPGSPSYIGDFLLYRRYMRSKWQELGPRISGAEQEQNHSCSAQQDYETRTLHYVQAMDQLAQRKAREIETVLTSETWEPPVLDVGGGVGSLSRVLIRNKGYGQVTLFELPEVIRAARSLYADGAAWDRFRLLEGDFRTFEFDRRDRFGLIVLSNFLHAYSRGEARELLQKSVDLLEPDGLVLVHDYFPDRWGRYPQKGALYDLNMMLNTYDGACHDCTEVAEWLQDLGMGRIRIQDLTTDSSVILASREKSEHEEKYFDQWIYEARSVGLRRAVLLPVEEIVTAAWVRLKCKCGCAVYGRNLQCPPHSMEHSAMKEMLESYAWCLLVEGAPPGREFHASLLQLERKAFLTGFHKALAFGAGPCPVCQACPEDGTCRRPDQARPSMEGSGIDVYTTARNAGIRLEPVTDKDRYVKYIGLLLLE
jgi:predicted metal-binding protein/cyclopropane fatty-acyl-phospholipid synthase-like methyltransferase